MTQYSVYLTEKINDPDYGEETTNMFDFYKLSSAKKFIKKHIDIYKSSCITKIWSNGDWENLGEIKLTGNNKHFVANTKATKAGY